MIVNVGHPADSPALERALTATIRAALPHVARDAAQPTNTQVIATTSAAPSAGRLLRADLPRPLRPLAERTAARLQPGLSGGDVWTDDRAPVEWLVDSSILQVAAQGER